MAATAGIVLAGGRSSRMGTAKAALEWHGSTLLRRVAGIVSRAVGGPVAVVRAPGQALPALPPSVAVVEDAREGRGPLQGVAAGLARVVGEAEIAYVSSTDVPLLHPAFVARMLAAITADVDIAVPVVGGRRHPLAAAYRTSVLGEIDALLARDRLRPALLFDVCRTAFLDERALLADAALASADPELASLLNVNEPGDYEDARARPGPWVRTERSGPRLTGAAVAALHVCAATLGAAAAELGLTLDGRVVATLNGKVVAGDPETPLVGGDVVGFRVGDAEG